MWRWVTRIVLVLFAMIAICAGWVHWRSYRISSVGHWYGEQSWVGIYCARGRIVVGVGRERVDAVIKHDFYERPVKAKSDIEFDDKYNGGRWLGIGYFQSHNPTVGYVLLPIWAIWGLASLPMALAIFKWVRKRIRSGSNLCVHCGYDLRGISGHCPECGGDVSGPVRSALV